MKALIAVMLLAVATSATAFESKYKYPQGALLIQLDNGNQVVCLERTVPESEEAAMPEGWFAATCNALHNALRWHECWIHPKSNSFMCGMTPVTYKQSN